MATMKGESVLAQLPVVTLKLIIIVQNPVWNPASATEGICSAVGSVNHLASVLVSTTIPTISQRRTSGRITSARRNAFASLIPGRLCVLILTASTVKYADLWMESRTATGIVPGCAPSKELIILLPLMVAPVTSLATALSYLLLNGPPGGVWKTLVWKSKKRGRWQQKC